MDADNTEWASEPIAVIGMSCKFSGGATSPDKLWDLMASGETGWSVIPADRFNLQGAYHPNHERTATTHVQGGHFLDDDVTTFDAAFFNYSAEMAQAVDPQFRLQLESTYEALENAGLTLPQVAGSQTSVFAGVFTHDYQEGIIRDEDRLPRFNVVGTWSPMASNRISHFFDLRGASMTLETGCSTTLVALHQAIQTLRSREAGMSVVTGANVMLNPDTFKAIGSLGMLSPDGRSFAFDARANGYGRGEGVATLVLKRLSDALANNDPVRAVIRETALNQDGRTDTITTPSGAAQTELMRACYRRAGLDPRGTQYFEAHGTGTPTGDPIEGAAMAAVFAEGRDRDSLLRIGSVKTNVGHTEAASGLAAVVKGVLCLEKGLIPPTVNYETPNPKLKLDEWKLKVATAMEAWPKSLVEGGPSRMSINNFGYGGSNAHVIMESAEPWASTPDFGFQSNGHANGNGYGNGHTNGNGNGATTAVDNAKVLTLSARDERGCQQLVDGLKAYLETKSKSLGRAASAQLLDNLAYTLGERRTLFQWVATHQVRLGSDHDAAPLDAAIQALDTPRFKPTRRPATAPRVGMVFTGQGAQWHAMGRELMAEYPVFRHSIEESEAFLKQLGADWSLGAELRRDKASTQVHATAVSIPICVAVQIGLVRLLAAWGITPTAVTSHSSGEIAAAYAAGALGHRQAMAAAYYRAVLAADNEKNLDQHAAKGGMAAVALGTAEAQTYLERVRGAGKAVIACVNSPQSVTVSGDAAAVQMIVDLCKQDGVFARRLRVQQAYHSHHMAPFAEAYRESLRRELAQAVQKSTAPGAGPPALTAAFSSAVTGGRMASSTDIASPDHWVRSLVQPVEFVAAFTDMVLGDPDDPSGRSVDVLLEVGPHTALGGPIREILSLPAFAGIESPLPYWGCLVRDEHAGDSMRSAAVGLFRAGVPVATGAVNFPHGDADDARVLTDLPSYPWNHSMRHFQESRINRAIRERSQPPHELLGMPMPGQDPSTAVWRRVLRVHETPWIRDHMVQGSIVFPGAGSLCLAIEAIRQLEKADDSEENATARAQVSGFRLRDVRFLFALVVPDGADGVEIRTTLRPAVPGQDVAAGGWRRFEVSTVTQENRWTLHCEGLIMAEREMSPEATAAPSRPLSAYRRHKDPQDMFAHLRARGVYHGPLFQNTTKIVQDGWEPRSVSDITVRHEASADTDAAQAARTTLLHPITLDAVVVAFYATLPGLGAAQDDPKLPRSIASMWVSGAISRDAGQSLRCDASLLRDDAQSGAVDITVADGRTSATVLTMQALECASLGRGSGAAAAAGKTAATARDQGMVSRLDWGPDLSVHQPRALAQLKKELTAEDQALGQVALLLRRIVHKNPGSARVLQIGGGASTAQHLLGALGSPSSPLVGCWQLTEPATEGLDEARALLAAWSDVLALDTLDIDESPAQQKFDLGSYDVVVCWHALGRARDVEQATANVHALLKPGGSLLLAEPTEAVVSGETAGARSVAAWDAVLQEAGFGGIGLDVSETHDACSIILSTVPAAPSDAAPADHVFAIVTSSKTQPPAGLVSRLSTQIRALAGSVAVEHLVLETAPADAFRNRVCVFVGELGESLLQDIDTPARFEGLRAMATQCGGLLWVTRGGAVDGQGPPEQALSQGFLRVLRNEYVGRRYLSLDVDPAESSGSSDTTVAAIVQVLQSGFVSSTADAGPVELEYAERDGVLLIPRVYKDDQYNDIVTGSLVPSWGDKEDCAAAPLEPLFQDGRPLKLAVGIPGHLDTLAYVDDDGAESQDGSPALLEISPRAFGVGPGDVLAAMGQAEDRALGLECAGIVTRVGTEAAAKARFRVGDRVMAIVAGGTAFGSRVSIPCDGAVALMPAGMDFATAASMPLAFTTAYAALVDTARITAGQSLLVHSAPGGVAPAAILLAKYLGVADIYATAASDEDRQRLQHVHGIPAARIFDKSSFAPALLAATEGRGVDVVLHSLPSALLPASLAVLAPLGHLVNTNHTDASDSSQLPLAAALSHGVSLTSLDVPTLARRRGGDVRRVLEEISRLVEQKVLQPVRPVSVHPMQDVQAAFQLAQTETQTSKVVLSAAPDEHVPVVRPRGFSPRTRLRPDASYLVVGGVGGIGRSVAHWLVEHGAKNLILLSRSAGDLDLDQNAGQDGAGFVRELRAAGCRVKPVSCDVALASELSKALRACQQDGLPPVRGVVQGAMLLRDAVFEQMSLADWHAGLRPKLAGTWNLHTEFAAAGALDFFVMLSSVSGVVGITSQSNYAAGGAYEDAMARWRQARGLPGVAIDLGPIDDVGFVAQAENKAVNDRFRRDGSDFAMLGEQDVLRALHAAVLHPAGRQSRPQIIVGLNTGPGAQWDRDGGSQLGQDARFQALRYRSKTEAAADANADGSSIGSAALAAQLAGSSSRQEAALLIGAAVAAKLADIFLTPVEEIDLGQPPAHYGVDSLVAVELRNMLVLQAAADISIFTILQAASLAALATTVAEKSRHLEGSE